VTEDLKRLAQDAIAASAAADDPDYPCFHVVPPVGRLNDPNGLLIDGDTYHAFYQLIHQGTQLIPADFIAEGVDQTRGWFFTLHAIATMVRGTNSYKAVISNGLVLDKNGNKMSKRLGNAVDPFETIEKYGSDPLRWYMISNSSPWDNLKFDVEGIDEVRRKFFATLYNTYQFFALYANLDGFDPTSREELPYAERPEIDRWILSTLNSLILEVDSDLEDYEPTRAARAIGDFVSEQLSNWYVRLSRRRFWAGEMTTDKLSAYQTLYRCLVTVASATGRRAIRIVVAPV